MQTLCMRNRVRLDLEEKANKFKGGIEYADEADALVGLSFVVYLLENTSTALTLPQAVLTATSSVWKNADRRATF